MVVKRQDRRGPWRVDFNGALAEAAAQGHLETAKWLYKYESCEPSRGNALGDAAANGHLAVVQWLWGQGVRDREIDPIDFAAANGHLQVVQWLHGRRGGRSFREINFAAAGGHLEVVKWLHDEGGVCGPDAMDDAAANGHFEVVKWLHANMEESVGNMCTDKAYVSATCNGHFEVMKWLSAHHGRTHEMTIADDAASHGRLDALKWMRSVGSGHITERAMDEAATNGHLEVVKWLHAHNNGCTTAAMDGAAKNGHLAVVKWLHDNRGEGCTTDAMVDAAGDGHLDVVCWLHNDRTQSCTAETIKRAAANGHLEVVRWLYKEFGNQFSLVDLMDSAALAAIGGHLKVVQVLATNSQFSDPKYLTPLMANAFMYGRVAIVEWLLGLGYQVRAKDTIWVQESRSWGTAKPDTMQIIYKGSEVSVPDVRRFIVRRRDIRMVRWLWCHGCNLHTFKDFHRAVGCNNIVLTRWLIENGVRLDRDATWINFWYDDYPEIVEWVPESDRVWVVREALATNEEDRRSLEKVLWVLENVEFRDVSLRSAIRNAISQASTKSLQWINAHLQNPEVQTS